MEYVLKVSPKGQVVLPKKLRESLDLKGMVAIEVRNHTGIVRKPKLSSEKLAGCFKTYGSGKKISSKEAIEKAIVMVAHETAGKNR
jgi:AbrB family looped-hinge helix DNA binding protein